MNPYDQYRQQMMTTMTQGDMLRQLYDGALKHLQIAHNAIQQGQFAEMDRSITKALAIVRYLRSALDFRIPISYNLAKLYDFFDMQLVNANIKKDTVILAEVTELLADLRNTFDECDKIDRAVRSGAAAGDVV